MRGRTSLYSSRLPLQSCTASLGTRPRSAIDDRDGRQTARNQWEDAHAKREMVERKLAQQKIMQVQSAADPPKTILLGERAVMADGNDYNLLPLKDQGKPVEVVYATERSPLVIVPRVEVGRELIQSELD
jgi:hypothetical protein